MHVRYTMGLGLFGVFLCILFYFKRLFGFKGGVYGGDGISDFFRIKCVFPNPKYTEQQSDTLAFPIWVCSLDRPSLIRSILLIQR